MSKSRLSLSLSLSLVSSLLLSTVAAAKQPRPPAKGVNGSVVLDGVPVRVWWNDGDSFKPKRGMREKPVRIVGYNTLETHGAVHQWGSWTGRELLALSVRATQVAGSKVRQCTLEGRPDAYGRPLARCPDVARELVGEGLAMVFAVKAPPDPELVALQSAAQAQRKGMWAGGVPQTIVTSVHSQDEKAPATSKVARTGRRGLGQAEGTEWTGRDRGQSVAYNRLVNTRTGETDQRKHGETFQICQVVCEGKGTDQSCITYVPFGQQRRNQPDCLR